MLFLQKETAKQHQSESESGLGSEGETPQPDAPWQGEKENLI